MTDSTYVTARLEEKPARHDEGEDAPVGDIATMVEKLKGLADAEDYLAGLGDDERDRHILVRDDLRQAAEALSRMEEREKELCERQKRADEGRDYLNMSAPFDGEEGPNG